MNSVVPPPPPAIPRLLRPAKARVEEWSPFFRSTIAVRTSRPLFVLTLDDGPDPHSTPLILDALARHRAHATFFVLLTRARLAPEILQRMIAEGHEVALHGEDHVRLTSRSATAVLSTLQRSRLELEELCGTPIRHFRPPYGAQTPMTCWAISRAGMRSVLWSASAIDGRTATTEERLARAVSGAKPGTILLAHDRQADNTDGADDPPVAPFDRAGLISAILATYASLGLAGTSLERALRHGTAHRIMRLRR